jgi:hypothetical protein
MDTNDWVVQECSESGPVSTSLVSYFHLIKEYIFSKVT